jgi:hypothetical protein
MLLDRYRQLLTAYVDGELSSRQRRHVVRLLHRSAEARQLLQQLKADSRALRQLPRPPLPADLADLVLRIIKERNLTPGQNHIVKVPATSAWMGPLISWAVAAAVLLVLGVASYFYFAASMDQQPIAEMAQKQPQTLPTIPDAEDLEPSPAQDDEDATEMAAPERPTPKIKDPATVKPPKVVKQRGRKKTKSSPGGKPPPAPKVETALTDRVERFQLEHVPDLLPVIVKLNDLDLPSTRKKLIDELGKDSAFRLELPCPNGTKAFDRVQKAARTLHLGLILDKPAQERIKLKWRTSYLLYMENVTPEELAQFVRQLGTEDRKSAVGKPAELQFDRLVLTRLTASHRKELITLMGVDPMTTVPSATGLTGTDPHNPLTDATARQVGQSLAGQGGAPRPEAGKPVPEPPEHIALVLAYNPVRPSGGSEEIKHFLESRKPARVGTLRVVLVLRSN